MPLNIINYTPMMEADSKLSPLNRVLATIRYGGDWIKEIQAQETVISLLKKLLSDRFTLIRNYTLPDEEIPIPLLLISGGGVWLIAVTEVGGILKTQGKDLYEMDSKTEDFVPKQPNLVMRTILLSRAFTEFLLKHKITIPEIEPVLIFTNPGVDVTLAGDTSIRVVLIDALSRFVSGLTVAPVRMEPGTTKKIVELIKYTHAKAKNPKKKSGGINLKFSQTQWIILGVMGFFLVLSIVLLIFLLLNI